MDTYLTESNLKYKTLYCDAPLEIKRYTYFNLQMHVKNAFLRDYEKETRILRKESLVWKRKRLGNTVITGGVQRSGGFLLPRAGTQ